MYCGAVLPAIEIKKAPPQRNLETFDRAFNAVLWPAGVVDERAEAALASAFDLDIAEAHSIIEVNKPLPLARCSNRQEAEVISTLIANCGLKSSIIADEDLRLDSELPRARRIAPSGDGLQVNHIAGVIDIAASEIKLMALGLLRNTRIDFTEGKTSIGARASSVLDTAEFRSDEVLIDVYTSSLERSFRVRADGFDYSGMVKPLSFRAEENFRALVRALRESAPHAVFDDDFSRVRGLFARAWPERSRTESQGLQKIGFIKSAAKSSVISDNRDQFERYSRLMFLFTSDQ
jgi:hypothetical protein